MVKTKHISFRVVTLCCNMWQMKQLSRQFNLQKNFSRGTENCQNFNCIYFFTKNGKNKTYFQAEIAMSFDSLWVLYKNEGNRILTPVESVITLRGRSR